MIAGVALDILMIHGCTSATDRVGVERGLLEAIVWHPARLSNLQMRVWLLVASGVQDVGVMAERSGAHRVSVSRALTSLCEHGLLRRAEEQGRSEGRYEGFSYEALNGEGNTC